MIAFHSKNEKQKPPFEERKVFLYNRNKAGDKMENLTETVLRKTIRIRPENSHKGTFGRAVLIGGNEQFGGAIIMSAEACVKSGAGLTTVITAEKNHAPLHTRLPEAMVVSLTDEALQKEVLRSAEVILIGPGLGLEAQSLNLLKRVLAQQTAEQWLVIDGSAITLFAQENLTLNFPAHVVFTPHQMEWERLSKIMIDQQTPTTNQAAQQKLQATVVLKSHRTELYFPDQTSARNPLGNAAMATGGTGDTLAGLITGFLAQFEKNNTTIAAAVYLHSLIGDALAQTDYVVLPTKISQQLPRYLKKFQSEV